MFIFRQRGREGERQGEKQWCGREISIVCLSYVPWWGLNLQPRHVLWMGNEMGTFCFVRQCSTNWATLVREQVTFKWKKSGRDCINLIIIIIPTPKTEYLVLHASWCNTPKRKQYHLRNVPVKISSPESNYEETVRHIRIDWILQ